MATETLYRLVKPRDNGPILPSFDIIPKQRHAVKTKVPSMCEIDEFDQLHWRERIAALCRNREESICDGNAVVHLSLHSDSPLQDIWSACQEPRNMIPFCGGNYENSNRDRRL